MAQAVSGSHLTIEARFQARVSTSGTCSGQSNTETGFSPSSLASVCQQPPIAALHIRGHAVVMNKIGIRSVPL
jgi:hypothetical protein